MSAGGLYCIKVEFFDFVWINVSVYYLVSDTPFLAADLSSTDLLYGFWIF